MRSATRAHRTTCLAFLAMALAWPVAAAAQTERTVPPLVRGFIAQNCAFVHDRYDEFIACIHGETAGYLMTLDLLIDADDPEDAAARYRGCAGQDRSPFHHRFHRHRAACMGSPVG